MKWTDRIMSVIAPRRAVQTAAARTALREMDKLPRRKRYAQSSHYASSWGRNTGRVEDAIPRMVLSRMRVRMLLSTNPYAAKVKQTLLNNLIGFGIVGSPKGAPKKVSQIWKQWTKVCDWHGRLDFYGLQDLAVGTMLADGECFIVRRFDPSRTGIVATRLEVLDAEMLFPGSSGAAIEYDASGRPTKYHFREKRAGLAAASPGRTVSFDAGDVIHLFAKDWPGQTRGHSLFEPVVKRFEDMDDYIEAEVVRKKIEACFAAFITPSAEYGAETTDMGGQTDELTENDFEVEVFEPGMIERLRPGDDIKFGDPKPSAAIGEFSRVTLLGATAGAGVPYEHGTGDLSNVNYSSYRAGSLEFQRFCGRKQWLLIIPVMLERIWDWVCEDAFQQGLSAKRFYDIAWTPPAFESIDRGKDAKAIREELELGLTSPQKEAGARGENFDELAEEIATARQKLADLGLEDLIPSLNRRGGNLNRYEGGEGDGA